MFQSANVRTALADLSNRAAAIASAVNYRGGFCRVGFVVVVVVVVIVVVFDIVVVVVVVVLQRF